MCGGDGGCISVASFNLLAPAYVRPLDLRTGEVNSLVYQDYFREYGMPIARQVESFEDGEWVSSLRLDEVKVNAGVIPWMFKMRD